MRDTLLELENYIENHPVINTHSHHLQDLSFQDFNLESILRQCYVGWLGVPFGSTYEERKDYLDRVRYNSYFVWLQWSLQDLYKINEPLSPENWDMYSQKIAQAHKNQNKHMELLKEKCRYDKVILDTFWEPGSNNGHPDIFTPTFRINMFLFGYSKEARDHNGNNPYLAYGKHYIDIDEYISFVRECILSKKQSGCVALKNALAYDRELNFSDVSRERAQKALSCSESSRTEEDIKAFQDYVFFRICETAAELNMPIQCHTGLGRLKWTNAMAMEEVISKNPATKFVLFHCSYPWLDDINGLLHNYGNVYPDLCWLPLISTSAAVRMLHEMIEVGTSDKICWGCDTWTSEESYGALLALRFILAKVLKEKIEDGYLCLSDARYIVDNIMYNNAARLYSL
jgi:hypothetical protein